MLLEVTEAFGRLRWNEAPPWLRSILDRPDPTLAHAAAQTLRRSRNWPAVLSWLEISGDSPLRPIALRALAEQADTEVVDGLLRRLETAQDPKWRREYAELLSRVYKKPGPWVYWGFRPEPRPPNTESWERTAAIETALDRAVADPNRAVRLAALQRMERERIPVRSEGLMAWLGDEREPEHVAAILSSLKRFPPETAHAVESVVSERGQVTTNRLAALQILVRGLDKSSEIRLLKLAGSLEESEVLAEALRQLGRRTSLNSSQLLLDKLQAASPVVRMAALEALAQWGTQSERLPAAVLVEARNSFSKLLSDSEPSVRAATAAAVGRLQFRENATQLLATAVDPDALVRRRSLEALTQLRDPRAVAPALRALDRDDPELLAALRCIAEVGGPPQADEIARAAMRSRSTEVLQAAANLLSKWDSGPGLAQLQGASGVILGWKVSDFLAKEEGARTVALLGERSAVIPRAWRAAHATNTDSRVNLGSGNDGAVRIAVSEFVVPEAFRAEFRLSSAGTLEVWLNGKLVHRRPEAGPYATDSDRFEADIERGVNRVIAQVAGKGEWHARFRRKSATERHERLSQLALATRGNPSRGRELFLNAERTACIKCHRLEGQGGGIGPDLTGVGRRFSKIHLIESILEPSRAIAPAFRNLSIRLRDGSELTGVQVTESEVALTIGDAQGQMHALRKDQIEELRTLELSIMPEGLESGITDVEFVDLIAFLAEGK